MYESSITLEVTSPSPSAVALYDEYRYRSERDAIIIVLNKFMEVAQYDEVRKRTLEILSIEDDYELSVDTQAGADFVYITVSAPDPELAQEIARVHTQQAIDHFGEINVLPLNQAIEQFRADMETTQVEVNTAEQALLDFQTEHGFVSLTDELNIQNNILDRLESLKAEHIFNLSLGTVDTGINIDSILQTPSGTEEKPTIDEIIEAQRQKILDLAQLEPEYNILSQAISASRDKYNILSAKYTEAELKASVAQDPLFIQVIDPPQLPESPTSNLQIIVFGIMASLGFSIILIFILDYVIGNLKSHNN